MTLKHFELKSNICYSGSFVGVASDILAATGNAGSSVSLKALRLFRVLRPLRLIAKFGSLKVVLDTILISFRTLFHVSMFICLLVLLYAITGMELFMGKSIYVLFL